ncbi:MAG: S-methyl-5-thioribose-1-phosphate isomerase [Candidatus Omnitrophota bacterium]
MMNQRIDKMKESVLFWPVQLKGQALYILDETKIPQSVVYLKASSYKGAIKAVVDMKTRAFGQFLTVCYAFMLEVKKSKLKSKEELMKHLETVAKAFNESRPTFPFEEVTGMVLGFARKVYESPDFKSAFLGLMDGFLEGGIRRERYERARRAAELIKDGDAVLTHCHVSGEMALIGEFCRKTNKKIKFFATETRPYFQGSRLTAWELKRQGLDVTLVADNAVGKLLSDGDIDCVIVGSDRSAANGDFANKIGTYQIALLAKYFHVPFYVLTQPSKKLKSGSDIPVEIRRDEEILCFRGKNLAGKNVKAYYPGFDVVPAELVTKHISINEH